MDVFGDARFVQLETDILDYQDSLIHKSESLFNFGFD